MYGTVFFETSAQDDKNIEATISSIVIASLNKLNENGTFGMRDESGWPQYVPSLAVVKRYCKLLNDEKSEKSDKSDKNKNCVIQ